MGLGFWNLTGRFDAGTLHYHYNNTSRMTDKNTARDSRLSMRKNNEEVYRKQFQQDTFHKCSDAIKLFGDCSKAQGIKVIFNCRAENTKSEFINEYH